MSSILTWTCFLLWIGFSLQDKTPDVTVTCFVSEECFLPCSFQPGGEETVEWLRQNVVVYKFERSDDNDDDDDSSDSSSSKEHAEHVQHTENDQLNGRASVSPHLVTRGNATLVLKSSSLKDRGTYRCHVHTKKGDHTAKVILKVEAPIQGLFLELSRLSGQEEVQCTVRDVFPAPRVTWTTEPPTFEDLRPVTRMQADKKGLYTVDSRLKRLNGQPDLIYICKVTTSYGGPAWTASLREREIRGSQGRDLTIPCSAPAYLSSPSLRWSFSSGEDPSPPAPILSYDSRSGHSTSSPSWDDHVELDGFRVPFGDGSLRLMDPKHSEHSGSYICEFSMPHSLHTERSQVTIAGGERSTAEDQSHWWIVAVVIVGLVLALAGMLAFLKLRGRSSKPRNDPDEITELHSVKDGGADSNVNESSPFAVGGTNRQSNLQTGTRLT